MSESDWGNESRFVVAATCIFVAGLLLFGVWDVSALNTKEAISASNRASQYGKDTKQQIFEACTVAELSAMQECVTEKVQSSEENQRASYDLAAQEAVARWTFWMLVLGVAGTAMTGFGLYFLAANLDEMRRARVISQKAIDAVEADQRAWIKVTLMESHILPTPHENGLSFNWKYEMQNFGKAVGIDIKTHTYPFKSTFGFAANLAVPHFKELALRNMRSHSEQVIFPGEKMEWTSSNQQRDVEVFSGPSELDRHYFVAHIVTYRTYRNGAISSTVGIYEAKESIVEGQDLPIFLRMSGEYS